MTTMASRKAVQEAVDLYFAGKITVAEAFRRAYGPDRRSRLAQRLAAVAEEAVSLESRPAGTSNSDKAKPWRKRKR